MTWHGSLFSPGSSLSGQVMIDRLTPCPGDLPRARQCAAIHVSRELHVRYPSHHNRFVRVFQRHQCLVAVTRARPDVLMHLELCRDITLGVIVHTGAVSSESMTGEVCSDSLPRPTHGSAGRKWQAIFVVPLVWVSPRVGAR